MTPDQVLKLLKSNQNKRVELWTLPIRLGNGDAIAAELIEIAIDRLGDDSEVSELLNVAGSLFWWVMTIAALCDTGVDAESSAV